MTRKLWPALLALLGGLVALIAWQHATFGASATLGEPFGANHENQAELALGGPNLELVQQIGGANLAVAVEGNYAYLGVGPRLVIFDISDPSNPTMVGQSEVLPDIVRGVAVAGNYAYVAANYHAGLRIINIANPSAPQEVGFYDTPGYAYGVAVAGSYAYVADWNLGLRVINIKNPSAPQEVGFYDTPGNALNVAIADDYAYVADYSGGLRIINIANSSAPQEVASVDTDQYVFDVAIAEQYAYLADSSNGLRIINISNPNAPQEIPSFDTPGYAYGVAIANDYAYVADHNHGLRIINIADPNAPQEVGSFDTSGFADVIAVTGNYAYLLDSDEGLQLINIATPSAPQEVASVERGLTPGSVAITGDVALVGNRNQLRLIDIANPSVLQEVASYNLPYYANALGIEIVGEYAYVAAGFKGLRIIDIATPSAPQEVGFYDTPGSAQDVVIAGDYAYVADGDAGLWIIDIKNPSAPQEVGSYNTPGNAQAVAVAGDYAYVADESSDLRIINIKNPSAPQEVTSYDTLYWTYDVVIVDQYAYVAADFAGLEVINIANPNAPQRVASFDTPGVARAVTIVDDYAYVADGHGGLQIINIANPSAPQKVADYAMVGYANDVTVVGPDIYVANGSGGFVILRLTGALTPTPTPTSTPINTAIPTATGLPTQTPSATPTPTPINTAIPTATGLPTQTPSATPTSAIGAGDNYEPDDVCEQARPITTNGIMQHRTFHQPGDTDWVSVNVTAGTEYLIEALTPADSAADVVLSVYDGCESVPEDGQDPSFSPDIRLQFVAPSSGTYYLQLSNDNLEASGASVAYDLSVRALADADEATPGALILVAGRYRLNDPLQRNIHNVTNSVYELFLAHDYTGDNIYYLATEEIDINNDGINDVDGLPNKHNLEVAITQWARDKVGPERALTVYLMDHGSIDRLYLNGTSQTVTPAELDSWLDDLEEAVDGVRVNLIVEACHAGSFIELEQSVSQAGRVVITSTGTHPLAYASEDGAYFSDAFIDALRRGMSLYSAFQEARTAAQAFHPSQSAWLDDNGDTLPNRANDGLEAQQRSFAFAGTLDVIQWPPYISDVEIGDIKNENGIITARIEDDQGVLSVWAEIYKPSYVPSDNSAEEMPLEILPSIRLRDENGDGIYSGLYENFSEEGEYRIVIYATDVENLQGEPVSLKVQVGEPKLYLPILMR